MKNSFKKILNVSYFIVCLMLLTTIKVDAYIDPSVMTYTIQAVAGIAIAIGAFVGIYFRKAKKRISNKLGIDENKNKTVESDDIFEKKEK